MRERHAHGPARVGGFFRVEYRTLGSERPRVDGRGGKQDGHQVGYARRGPRRLGDEGEEDV